MLIRVEQGKGGRDRNAMLSPQLLELLRMWWREGKRRGVMFPHGWLFPGRSYSDPISTRQLHRAVQEAAEVAGIRKRVGPHTLRHSIVRHRSAGSSERSITPASINGAASIFVASSSSPSRSSAARIMACSQAARAPKRS
jgi:integrase